MTRPDIHEYYMNLALAAARRAGCPKRQVGAVITDKNNRILSTGYNSPPRDLPVCLDVPCGGELPEHDCVAAHAEISAITVCRAIQEAHNMYITCSPCVSCMQAIMATNIQNIYFGEYHKTWVRSKRIWTGRWSFINVNQFK